MDNHKFLHAYMNAYSPVGREIEGQKIWVNYMKQFTTDIKVDAYGTAYAKISATSRSLEPRRKVVLEAHCDEIAWIVTQIEEKGLVRVKRHGGSDTMIAASKTVAIHTHDGKTVKGLFGWPAVHVRKEWEEKGPAPHELWIDLGVDSAEKVAELGVEVGNCVTFDDPFFELGDYYVGKSLDNKIGGYIIAEAARKLAKSELPFDLYIVNSVQEEVGLYGARLIAQTIKPDIAFVHDVTHETSTPRMEPAKNGDIKAGKGPVIEYSSQNHRDLIDLFRQVSKNADIPMQHAVGSYGNDTVSFFMENCPTAILASPLKYMHTTVEMVHKQDVENAISAFVISILELNPIKIAAINDQTSKYI